MLIKNKTRDNLLVVLTPPDTPDVNVFLSKSEVSFEIKGDSFFPLTLQKKDIEKSLGQLTLEFRVIGKATRAGLYPKQIITPIAEDRKQEEDNEETEIPEFRSKQWDY